MIPFFIALLIGIVWAISALVSSDKSARQDGYESYRLQWREKDVANWLAATKRAPGGTVVAGTPMSHQLSRIAGSFGATRQTVTVPALTRATGGHVSATKVSPPPQAAGPVTDPIASLGLAVGWALIVVGLLLLVLAVTN